MDFMMIDDVLKTARDNIKLSQTDVAEKLNVTKQTYLKWENGITEPKASQISKLAEVLKITESEICKGELNTRMPIENFIIEMSKIDADAALITLRTWEQLPNHREFLYSLTVDSKKTEEGVFQII